MSWSAKRSRRCHRAISPTGRTAAPWSGPTRLTPGRSGVPQAGPLVPVVRVGHVVAGQDLALHLEEVLRVAQMIKQVFGDRRLRLHDVGESLRPGLQDGIGVVPRIEL